MRATEYAFVGRICFEDDELIELLETHLTDYDEVLPHVFMGDLTRWAVARFCARPSDGLLERVLRIMEAAYGKREELYQEIISVSFLENLPTAEGEDGFEIRFLLGANLRRQLDVVETPNRPGPTPLGQHIPPGNGDSVR